MGIMKELANWATQTHKHKTYLGERQKSVRRGKQKGLVESKSYQTCGQMAIGHLDRARATLGASSPWAWGLVWSGLVPRDIWTGQAGQEAPVELSPKSQSPGVPPTDWRWRLPLQSSASPSQGSQTHGPMAMAGGGSRVRTSPR